MHSRLMTLLKSLCMTLLAFCLWFFSPLLSNYEVLMYLALFLLACFLIFKPARVKKMTPYGGELLIPFMQSLEEGVLLLDQSLRLVVCNRSLSRLLGVSAETLKKDAFLDIKDSKRQEVLEKAKKLVEALSLSEPEQREGVMYKRGLQAFHMDITAMMINEKDHLLIFRDTHKPSQAINLGKDFIANASHELRTPITIIKGFVETLKEMPEISEAMLDEIFNKILRSCIRMDRIVKDLLILTDLDHASLTQKKSFDLVTLVENCRHTLLEVHPSAEISFETLKKEMMTRADPNLLELALMNLLQNAVKYSKAPAKIQISLSSEGDEFTIEIADQGCGIPKESLSSVFNRFYSVDKKASRKLGGAGLGLSIVKAVVEKHQGEIKATNNINGGTTFTISLPAG